MISRYYMVVIYLIGLPIIGWGQRATGLRLSPERYQLLPVLPAYTGAKYNEIPLKVDLKTYTPIPGDQGKMGSCVGWAVGYGALTTQYAILNNLKDRAQITQLALSAAFIYNQIRLESNNCQNGVLIEDALELVHRKGDCLYKNFDLTLNSCKDSPQEHHLLEAQQFGINDYAAVFTSNEPEGSKITKACKILAAKVPLIVGMDLTSSFWQIGKGSRQWMVKPDEKPEGMHAMLLVGYDNVKKQFELMNSFGAAWGNNGYIYISFKQFERLCRFAYVMNLVGDSKGALLNQMPGKQPSRSKGQLSGEFVLRQPAGYLMTNEGEEIPFFEEVPTKRQDNQFEYTPQKQQYQVGDAFQLVARKVPAGKYVYVFSKSSTGKMQLHFPKKQAGQKVTANFIISDRAEIVIPEEWTVLQLGAKGTDYLCILYSTLPIPNIKDRISNLNDIGDHYFVQTFKEAFEDILIDQQHVHFVEDKMSFSVHRTPKDSQIAVPIILKIIAN